MLFPRLLFALITFLYLPQFYASPIQLVSTESDPDAFILDCVNVINGDYCEAATDLVLAGPDSLILQRYYSKKEFSNSPGGGWKIFPQRFLVIGKDFSGRTCTMGKERFEWAFAFTGERSGGGILPYSGWKNANGTTKDPLKIDVLNHGIGMVNTYAKQMNGQTNHQNNQLYCKGDTCELVLGDKTRRIYKKVQFLPSLLLGEEITPQMTKQVTDAEHFLLMQEILPSGNQIFFSYDKEGHLIAVEMKNASCNKMLSWIHFSYTFTEKGCNVQIETSDSRELTYTFALVDDCYQLLSVNGSHCIPISYEYGGALVKKNFPEGRFIEIEYQEGKVKALKKPNAQSGKAETIYSFSYGENYTDVFDAMGAKTRYAFDNRFQLRVIERYDSHNALYRKEQKFWGETKSDAGLLLAKAISDGEGRTRSYRSFQYDKSGNVVEERLYGNLTGKQEVSLQISSDGKILNPDEEECHIKTFGYSSDGFNMLTKVGDNKGNQTLYTYKPGTNLLITKFIFEKSSIKKRTFQTYNDDGVCIKMIEDDGSHEEESKIYGWCTTERHIKEIKPKDTLPGVGLPETIEEKALDLKTKQEFLIRKLVNTYDDQSNLLSCSTYDANNQYAFTEKRTYTAIGLIASQIDAVGREVSYTYDGVGNQTSRFIPHENRLIKTTYDFHNNPIQITEANPEEEYSLYNAYDVLGRKISSSDRFGNAIHYEYDAFHRLIKVIYPEVLDENERIKRPTFSYAYDIFGNVIKTTDPAGFVTTKSYNLYGSPTKIAYPDGSFELFKYDTEGSLHRSLTREQIITVYEYDYLGRPVYEEISTSSETGVSSYLKNRTRKYNGFRCISEKDSNHGKHYSFDPAGRVISVIEYGSGQSEDSAGARLTEFSYDALGRAHQKRVWFDLGRRDYSVECFEYDLANNIAQKRMEDADGNILLQRYYSFNLQDQCTEEYTIENGIRTTLLKTVYNSQGAPIAFFDGLGNETKIMIDNDCKNALGQKVPKKTVTNPLGVQTEISFDALGRIDCVSKKDSFGVLLYSQKNIFDLLGNKTCEIHDQIIGGEIISSQKTQRIYGPMGRLEEEMQEEGSSIAKRVRYEYNSLGKLASKTISGTTTSIEYTYNKEGYLHKIEAQNNKKELKIANTYSYDQRGNILSASSSDGKSVQRSYYALDQVSRETIKDGEGTYTLEYQYDRKGRLKEIKLPDHSKIAYTYNAALGQEVKRISPQGEVLYTHTYESYDTQGKLLFESHIGYVGSHEYNYDLNSQKTLSKSDLLTEEYTRDSLGRITEVKGSNRELYAYNGLSQLISEKKTESKTYTYDSLDNCIKINNDELIYNALNQLTSHSGTEFTYDTQGNLLKKVLDEEETRFESNILSQLISIEKADHTSLSFSYDPFGRLLVEKHLDNPNKNKKNISTTRYFYLGYQEIGTLSQAGAIETLKIPGLKGDELSPLSIAFEIKGEAYVPFHDIAGNVVQLVDPRSREIIERYQYTIFGEESIFNAIGKKLEKSALGNPWRFAEKRKDPHSGFIFFGLRFYDPTIGRWISSDPGGFIDGPNLYAYLHNNPLNYLDRFGLAAEANSQNKFEEYFYGEVETHCFCEKHRTCKRGGDIGKTIGAPLPKITYDDFFEKYYKDYRSEDLFIKDCYDNSTCFDLNGLPDLPNDLRIGFINGIWNDFQGAQASAQYLSRLAGGYNIHGVYNATHGTDVDVGECGLGLNYIATEPVRQLHKMWNSFFEKSSANAKFLMICHSQGGIHVRNALLDYPPELRERILVVAIAPGAYIYQETCAKVIHYRVEWWRDFVPRFDSAGAKREKNTIFTLDSHPDAPPFDHEFMSPTYKKELRKHLINYINTNGSML